MAAITIPYTPRYPDVHKVLESKRFAVLVAHRRFGKTVLVINHLLKQALLCQKPRGSFAYVAPMRNQAKVVAWDYLKHYSAPVPGRMINESELCITLPAVGGSSKLRIFGADNPDALRGLYFDAIVLDEVAQMKTEVWEEVVRPALSDRAGSAVFIGTPKGINLFSDKYYEAVRKQEEGDPDWAALCFPVTATGALPADEVERIRSEQSENTFRREYLCDFAASADDILISIEDVSASMDREHGAEDYRDWPLIVGVDVARMGEDSTVFFARRGNYAAYEPVVMRKQDNMEVVHRLFAYIAEHKPDLVCIDQGEGTGVHDRLVELTRHMPVAVQLIPFGSRPLSDSYVNRRAEMWHAMADWIRRSGRLPKSEALKAELTAPTYSFDSSGRIKLEPKEDIKKRLRRSTDYADALALTFALPYGPSTVDDISERMSRRYGREGARVVVDWMTGEDTRRTQYDPFA